MNGLDKRSVVGRLFPVITTMPSKDRRDQYDIEQRIKVSTMLKTKMIVTTPKQIIETQ